jgi:hypothetical protein
LSNPSFAGKIREAADAVVPVRGDDLEATAAISCQRRWRVIERLGEKVITKLLADRDAGMTTRKLVERYGISLSSVKRLLAGREGHQARRAR